MSTADHKEGDRALFEPLDSPVPHDSKTLGEQNSALSRLLRFSIDLSRLPSEANLEAFALKRLMDISGAEAAIFNEYDAASRSTVITHVEADSRLVGRIASLLGRQLIGFRASMSDEIYRQITTDIVAVSRTLHEASFGEVPRVTGAAIQALLGADRFIGVAYMIDGRLYGSSLVAMHKDTPDPPESALKSFSFLVALALRRQKAELALRESEARNRMLTENTTDIIWIMDVQGRLTYVSPSVEKLRGYTPEEVMRQPFTEALAPASAVVAQARLREAAEAALAGRRVPELRQELEQPCKDGSTVWTETRANVLYDSAGRFVGFLGASRDITHHKRAEAGQEMGREILRILNEPGSFAASVGRVIAVLKNGTGFDSVGIRLAEGDDFPYISTSGFSPGFVEHENNLAVRDVDHDICRNAEGQVSLECTCGLVISGMTDPSAPFFSKGGSFWTNDSTPLLEIPAADDRRLHPRNTCIHTGYLSIALVPIRDQAHIVGLIHLADRRKGRLSADMVGSLENIAALIGVALVRKQAEAALIESQHRYEALVNLSPDAIVVDLDRTLVFANPAAVRLFGAESADQLVGRGVLERMHPDFRDVVSERAARVTAGIAVPPLEIKIVRFDGTPVDVEVTAASVEFDGRRANQVVYRDITERKRAEAKQRELERQLLERQKLESLGVLAGGIAHDFNNMLTAILGYSEMILAGGLSSPEETLSDLAEIKRAAERAKALTGAILAFSRRQPREPQVLALNTMVADLEPLLRRTLGEDIDLVCTMSSEDCPVEIDPSQFTQVLMNLVVNARDAMPDGGRLTLEVTRRRAGGSDADASPVIAPGEWSVLTVSDTGVGMDPELVPRIFEPFFTTKAPGEGTGLGLSTTYGIVKQSGGDIVVHTERGRGTTFEVYLPRVDGETAQSETGSATREDEAEQPAASDQGSIAVLLVEDEPAVRRLATRILGNEGYTVLQASDGVEALGLARDHSLSIDLLLTDVVLPGALQGADVARSILNERPALKVLFMSGYPRGGITQSGRLEEGINYLEKPFTANALIAKLREVLAAGT